MLFVGCINEQIAPPQSPDVAPLEVPKEIKQELDENLIVDAIVKVPANLPSEAYKYIASFFIVDTDTVFQNLFANEEIINQIKNPPEDGTNKMNTYYTSKEGSSLLCGAASISYAASLGHKVLEAFRPEYSYGFFGGDENYNADQFLKDKSLSFRQIDDAASEVRNLINGWGIDLYSEGDAYTLDFQTLEEQHKIISNEAYEDLPKRNWSIEDDCYYFSFSQAIDNIPVSFIEHGNPDDGSSTVGTKIKAIISSGGIQYLECSCAYRPVENSKESVKLISVEDALSTVKKKYANIIVSPEIRITSIEFCYVPCKRNKSDNDFELIPAWVFKAEQADENYENLISLNYVIVNAETGEEIL